MTSLLAQIDPQAVEATTGQVAASLLMLAALGGGLMIARVWQLRIRTQRAALPEAHRRPLNVPLPLMLLGLVWVSLMAVTVLSTGGSEQAEPVAPTDESQLVEAGLDDDSQQSDSANPANADDSANPATPAESAAPGKSTNPGEGDNDNEVAATNNTASQDLTKLVAQNLTFQLGVLAAFGTVLLVVQQGFSRRISRKKTASSHVAAAVPEASDVPTDAPAVQLWPDLDAPATVSIPPATSAADAIQSDDRETVDDLEIVDSDQTDSEMADRTDSYERWHLPTELRFAAEVFLVALPFTFALRLLLVWILQDPSQHPFLELLEEGVDVTVMALIAVMAVIVAPLAEELLYRVIVLGGLMQAGSVALAWITSSVLFALAHGFPDSIALLPLAFAIGYAYIRRRSYRTVMLIHFLFNGFNLVLAGLAWL